MNDLNINYFIIVKPLDEIREVIILGECCVDVSSSSQLKNPIKKGDILFFYPQRNIDGIIGFATINKKTKLKENAHTKIEFERNYCLPYVLWQQQNIRLDNINIDRELNILDDKEEINRISNLISLRWGAEFKSKTENNPVEAPIFLKNKCAECGKDIDSRAAKYCTECKIKVQKKQSLEWNRINKDKIREANKRWRENHPDKLREYNRRWKEKHPDKIIEQKKKWEKSHPDKVKEYIKKWKEKNKKTALSTDKMMSEWCKELRKNPQHIYWINKQKKRREKIAAIEKEFDCCWEDKIRELFENYTHEDAAKILGLNYRTLFVWAKHLGLRRTCVYCQNKVTTKKGNFHQECKEKYEFEQNRRGVKELLVQIKLPINIEVVNLNNENIAVVLREIVSKLPKRESNILKNRYIDYNIKNRKTLEELGKEYGVTRERIRQIEEKAICRLNHPSRVKVITEKLMNVIFKDKGILLNNINNKVSELEMELNILKGKLAISGQLSGTDKPLDDIELSVRASNCLRFVGIKTLAELASKSESEILSIPNAGKTTLCELREVLNSFGLSFKKEASQSNPSYLYRKAYSMKKIRQKCLFIGCKVTPHKGRYCSKHKTAWQRKRTSELLYVDTSVEQNDNDQEPEIYIKSEALNIIEEYFDKVGSAKGKSILFEFAKYCNIPSLDWKGVTAADIERYNTFQRQQGKSQLNISSNMSILRQFFDFLQDKGIIEGNITRAITVPAGREHLRQRTLQELKEEYTKFHPRA